MEQFGLIGYPLGHSFSKQYFTKKFHQESINASYDNYQIPPEQLKDIRQFILEKEGLRGLNVTIPHKEAIIPFLDELSPTARAVGAVNVVEVRRQGGQIYLVGHNTDCIGFKNSLLPLLPSDVSVSALVLGTGGASKAVAYALKSLDIPFHFVSRKSQSDILSYEEITEDILRQHKLIINTTPLGMYPNTEEKPLIPYQALTASHIVYDLVYNPEITTFMSLAHAQGAVMKNGLEMLHLQADAAWDIWHM